MISEWLYYWPTEEESKHRLSTLSKFLREQVPEDKLDMSSWVAKGICGFAGCAVGWATTIPEFQELGFYIEYNSPRYKHSSGWDAVREFFGLEEEVMELFSPVYYRGVTNITPDHVADRIDEFLGRMNHE